MGSWLDDAEQRAEAAQFSSNPEVICALAEDAPRAYALIRQLGEALALVVPEADAFLDDEPSRVGDAALAAFREATEDRG